MFILDIQSFWCTDLNKPVHRVIVVRRLFLVLCYQAEEPLARELFNHTVVRMGDWMAIHNSYGKNDVWNLYNLANDIGQNTNVADQHPDIVEKAKAAYDKYATDVGVIIPRGKSFAAGVASMNATQRIAADNTVDIDLPKMFVPGHKLELNPLLPLN